MRVLLTQPDFTLIMTSQAMRAPYAGSAAEGRHCLAVDALFSRLVSNEKEAMDEDYVVR